MKRLKVNLIEITYDSKRIVKNNIYAFWRQRPQPTNRFFFTGESLGLLNRLSSNLEDYTEKHTRCVIWYVQLQKYNWAEKEVLHDNNKKKQRKKVKLLQVGKITFLVVLEIYKYLLFPHYLCCHLQLNPCQIYWYWCFYKALKNFWYVDYGMGVSPCYECYPLPC